MRERAQGAGRCRRGAVLAALLVLAAPAASGAQPTVVVRYDPAQVPHVRFIAAFEEALARVTRAARLELRPLGDPRPPPRADAVLAVGYEALARALGGRRPVVAALVPRVSLELAVARAGRRLAPGGDVTGVYLDQPPRRSIRLVRLVLPGARELGVLLGPTSARLRHEIERAARAQGFRLRTADIGPGDSVPRVAERLLDGVDALLAVPDPLVYNRYSLHGILLAAYHHHVPMFGFSRAYVRAGALAAVYSEPQDLAVTAARLCARALRRRRIPPPVYPEVYRVSVNRHVARSLGLLVREEAELLRELRRGEGRKP